MQSWHMFESFVQKQVLEANIRREHHYVEPLKTTFDFNAILGVTFNQK